MIRPKYVLWLRVSSRKQEDNYSREAQEKICLDYITSKGGEVQSVHEVVESARKVAKARRLQVVLDECKRTGAILVFSHITRLSRDAPFLISMRDSGITYVCASQPHIDHLSLSISAVMAQNESDQISERTKLGQAVARSKGKLFGMHNPKIRAAVLDPENVARRTKRMKATMKALGEQKREAFRLWAHSLQDKLLVLVIQGKNLSQMARILTEEGVLRYNSTTNTTWHARAVSDVLQATIPNSLELIRQKAGQREPLQVIP